MVNAVRRLPAIALVVVLALLPLQAWLRASRPDVRYPRPLDELAGVEWAATVSPDGHLSITIVYDVRGDDSHDSSIRLPSGARFLHADGEPIPSPSGRYADVTSQGKLTVTYERVGAVTRYHDGVIVDFAGIEGSDQLMFPCARCYLGLDGFGNTSLTGALFANDLTGARLAMSGVEQLHTGDDAGALRFVSVLHYADSAGLLAWLPVAAAPGAPTASEVPNAVAGETAEQVWEATVEASDNPLREADSGPPIGRLAAAIILTALWAGLVAWIVQRMVAANRVLAEDRPDAPPARDAPFSPPSKLEPAVVGVLVGDAGPGDRSAVAATLLALAQRGAIEIEGVTSDRYTLTIRPGARGNSPYEDAVLTELRPQGKATSAATLTGPPLWGAVSATVTRRFAALAIAGAKDARLVRVTLTAIVLVPASLIMGIVAVIASGGSSWLAWLITFVGPIAALVVTMVTGISLTAKGRAERKRWLDYGDWLRQDPQLAHVGAPGVVTWGKPLVYATVLGAAPTAARALGTG